MGKRLTISQRFAWTHPDSWDIKYFLEQKREEMCVAKSVTFDPSTMIMCCQREGYLARLMTE